MVGRPIDGTVIDVVLVRGAILTCFFGSTLAYDFFMAFDLREIGETLAVFRSTFLPNEMVAALEDVDCAAGNVSNFMVVILLAMPFTVATVVATAAIVSLNSLEWSSFCCCVVVVVVECDIAVVVGRTTIFVKSFRRLGSAFI